MNNEILKLLKKRRAVIISTVLGATAGYLYYRFVGCASGSCAISSNPYISTVYGGITGWLLGASASGSCNCSRSKRREEENE